MSAGRPKGLSGSGGGLVAPEGRPHALSSSDGRPKAFSGSGGGLVSPTSKPEITRDHVGSQDSASSSGLLKPSVLPARVSSPRPTGPKKVMYPALTPQETAKSSGGEVCVAFSLEI